MTAKFCIGDKVSWVSSSHGYTTKKTGFIAQVVEPMMNPDPEMFPGLFAKNGVRAGRKVESYVVMVGATPYWPRTKWLRFDER